MSLRNFLSKNPPNTTTFDFPILTAVWPLWTQNKYEKKIKFDSEDIWDKKEKKRGRENLPARLRKISSEVRGISSDPVMHILACLTQLLVLSSLSMAMVDVGTKKATIFSSSLRFTETEKKVSDYYNGFDSVLCITLFMTSFSSLNL